MRMEDRVGAQFQALDKAAQIAILNEATTLAAYQTFVRGTANTASDDWTLTLPPVAEARGLMYSIVATIANAKTITVTDGGDDSNFSDLTLDTDDDHVVLWSDGERWHVLLNGIA